MPLLEVDREHPPRAGISVDVEDLRAREAEPDHVGRDLQDVLRVRAGQPTEPVLADPLDLKDPPLLFEHPVTTARQMHQRDVDLHLRLEPLAPAVQPHLDALVQRVPQLEDRHQLDPHARYRLHANPVVVERAVAWRAERRGVVHPHVPVPRLLVDRAELPLIERVHVERTTEGPVRKDRRAKHPVPTSPARGTARSR